MTLISAPEAITAAFEAAWNAHDMQAFGALFDPAATFVNRFATYWRGREAIVAGHRVIHEGVYRDSTLAVDAADIDHLSDAAAILHFWTRLTAGQAHPAGPHQADTLILAVVVRRDGGWRIQAAENVTLSDPRSGQAMLREA
jgi:uncharacterized protein (TIGR02246 family)